MKSRFLILLVSLFLVVDVASGATITVRKDGAGDYSVIQQALDAAASGDTVLIGPGSYTEYTTVQPSGWYWAVESFGYSELPYLTIIGAGEDQTIIGPDVPMSNEAQIQEWIIDSSDDASIFATVQYSPYSGQSVPTESTSWGDLKALFR